MTNYLISRDRKLLLEMQQVNDNCVVVKIPGQEVSVYFFLTEMCARPALTTKLVFNNNMHDVYHYLDDDREALVEGKTEIAGKDKFDALCPIVQQRIVRVCAIDYCDSEEHVQECWMEDVYDRANFVPPKRYYVAWGEGIFADSLEELKEASVKQADGDVEEFEQLLDCSFDLDRENWDAPLKWKISLDAKIEENGK